MIHKKNFQTRKNTNSKFACSMLCKFLIIVSILQTFLFISCKDDPVTIKPPPDTTAINDDVYIWDMKVIHGYLRGCYAADTENVYINQGYNLLKYNGDTIVDIPLNDPGFGMFGIDGYDKNNVFIGGGYFVNGSNPILKKSNMEL